MSRGREQLPRDHWGAPGRYQRCTSVIATSCDHTDEITLPEASRTKFRAPKPKCKKKSSQILAGVVDLNPDSELLRLYYWNLDISVRKSLILKVFSVLCL